MFWEFLKRAYGPQVALIVVFTMTSVLQRRYGSVDPSVLVVIGMLVLPLLCYFLSDMLLTGGKTFASDRVPESVFAGLLIGGGVLSGCLMIPQHHKDIHWSTMPIFVTVADLFLFSMFVVAHSLYGSFVEHCGETVVRSQARHEALRYYNRHADFLAEEFPPSLFQAHLSSSTGDHLTSAQVWTAVRELLGRLEVHCQEGRRRQTERNARRKQIDKEIFEMEAKIEKLKKGTVIDDEEVVEEELLGCEHRLRELREQKDMLDTLS